MESSLIPKTTVVKPTLPATSPRSKRSISLLKANLPRLIDQSNGGNTRYNDKFPARFYKIKKFIDFQNQNKELLRDQIS